MQYEDGSISPLRAFFRNKWVRIILIIDVIAIFGIIGVLIWQATKVSTIIFNVAPIDATISVNGNTNYTNGEYALTPGAYEIEISHEGLETKTVSVNIEPQHVMNVTLFLADANSDFDFYKLKDNYGSYQKLKTIASADSNITTDQDASAESFISDFERTMSIMNILPIKGYVYAEPSVNVSTAGFTIHNGQGVKGCEKIACLLVNYYGKDYEEAVTNEINEAGYSPMDYQIIYERYN